MRSIDPTIRYLLGHTVDNGRLKLVKILGSGSGGVVFLGEEYIPGATAPKRYAVKVMKRAEQGTPAYVAQRREIDNHKAVSSHPNILTLHRTAEEGSYLLLVLDYCPGGDFFRYVTEASGNFCGNNTLVKHVFLQILDATLACHREGIFHRDIKPENIFCDRSGTNVVLGDFGLSTNNAYTANFGAGSMSYMSPECLRYDIKPDYYSARRNDVWALGVILTSMISGRNPWRYATTADPCFQAYLQNPYFFPHVLPISKGANDILRSIFTNTERDRVTLPKLRRMIVSVDTFFMTEAEIAHADLQVQLVAQTYFRPAPQPIPYEDSNTSYGEVLRSMDHRRKIRADGLWGSSKDLNTVALSDRPRNEHVIECVTRTQDQPPTPPNGPQDVRSGIPPPQEIRLPSPVIVSPGGLHFAPAYYVETARSEDAVVDIAGEKEGHVLRFRRMLERFFV